uniref:Uncharacterized protein n=1 Tax=Anguilla anguilla TaxID=7936 RepID=A0A0E9XF74_ANGAN
MFRQQLSNWTFAIIHLNHLKSRFFGMFFQNYKSVP